MVISRILTVRIDRTMDRRNWCVCAHTLTTACATKKEGAFASHHGERDSELNT
jgi:hypothetical protein